jgi:hypothetical protein
MQTDDVRARLTGTPDPRRRGRGDPRRRGVALLAGL